MKCLDVPIRPLFPHAALFLAAPFGSAGESGPAEKKAQAARAEEDAQRACFRAGVKALSNGRGPLEAGIAAVPGEATFGKLALEDRLAYASVAGKLFDKFAKDKTLSQAESEWLTRGLPVLRVSNGGQEAVLLERVYRDSIGMAGSLAELRQAERLVRAAYPEMAACGKAEPGGFDRTRLKKELIRKRVALLTGGAR